MRGREVVARGKEAEVLGGNQGRLSNVGIFWKLFDRYLCMGAGKEVGAIRGVYVEKGDERVSYWGREDETIDFSVFSFTYRHDYKLCKCDFKKYNFICASLKYRFLSGW